MSEYIVDFGSLAMLSRIVESESNRLGEPVVRCRDCKSYGLGRRCGWSKRFVTPDGFCAWRERRERESAEVWNQWSADDVTCSEES